MGDILSLKDNRDLIVQEMSTKASQTSVDNAISKIDQVNTTLASIKAKTDTITSSVITQAQANNLDATISSRQANAGLTTTHAGRIDASISSRATQTSVDAIYSKVATPSGNVKSIQKGQLLGASASSGSGSDLSYVDVPISSVNISKCVIFVEIGFGNNHTVASTVSGTYSTSVNGTYTTTTYRGLARLTSSTNLRIHNSAATASIVHGSWTIVEYY